MSMINYPNLYKFLNNKDIENNIVFQVGEKLPFPSDLNKPIFEKQFNNPVYRIPSMVITDSGRIIVVCDYRHDFLDQNAITPAIAISDDNGKTWRKKLVFPYGTEDNANARTMDPTMFIYKDVVHIICGRWSGTRNNNNWTQSSPNDPTWSMVRFYSHDFGETWNVEWNFQLSISNWPSGKSGLGAVGNSVISKFGTCIVPVQFAPATGKVSAGFIYTNNGTNWKMHTSFAADCSESSLFGNVNTSGNFEIGMISRRDPNNPGNKACNVSTQTGPETFTNFAVYNQFNGKIPARGRSGCQGSVLGSADEEGNFRRNQPWVTWSNNFFAPQDGSIRDHIVIGNFKQSTDSQNDTRNLIQLETLNLDAGPKFGGYSILYFNRKCNKLFVVFEDNGSIKIKNLEKYLPSFLQV